jgi:hypothetical protein
VGSTQPNWPVALLTWMGTTLPVSLGQLGVTSRRLMLVNNSAEISSNGSNHLQCACAKDRTPSMTVPTRSAVCVLPSVRLRFLVIQAAIQLQHSFPCTNHPCHIDRLRRCCNSSRRWDSDRPRMNPLETCRSSATTQPSLKAGPSPQCSRASTAAHFPPTWRRSIRQTTS